MIKAYTEKEQVIQQQSRGLLVQFKDIK